MQYINIARIVVFTVGLAMSSASGAAAGEAFKFDIREGVPDKQVTLIKKGLAIAVAYLDSKYGGAIPPDVQAKITVKIEATGLGNQELGGGGGAATGLDESGPRPYFDVAHEQWAQNTEGRGWTRESDQMKTVVHEYVHGWQSWLGAMDIHYQPLGNWMNEGIAEYIAYNAMIDAKKMSRGNVDKFELNGARGAETDKPLEQFGSSQTSAWPGHVGYLAIDWLIDESPNGRMALRVLAQEIANGASTKKAFATAFGIELDDFYGQFEVWRAIIVKSPGKALAKRPKLAFAGA